MVKTLEDVLGESVGIILDVMGGWDSLKLFIEAEEYSYSLDAKYHNVGHLYIKYPPRKTLHICFFVNSCTICEINEGDYTKNCRYSLNEPSEKRLFFEQVEWIIELKLNPF